MLRTSVGWTDLTATSVGLTAKWLLGLLDSDRSDLAVKNKPALFWKSQFEICMWKL